MKLTCHSLSAKHASSRSAFTLVEVVLSVLICGLVFSGILQCYTFSAERTQWAGYSMAAQALAIQQLEQARSGVSEPNGSRNELTNLNLLSRTYNTSTRTMRGYSISILDIPISGTNAVSATNFVTVRLVNLNNTNNPPVQVQLVQVDTVWPFKAFRRNQLHTNTVVTYVAPDDR
ncbi:MAG: hypothetical protein QM813_24465 [Verrucomicrobiota bacterium]